VASENVERLAVDKSSANRRFISWRALALFLEEIRESPCRSPLAKASFQRLIVREGVGRGAPPSAGLATIELAGGALEFGAGAGQGKWSLSEYLSGAAEVVAGPHKREWLRTQQQRMKTNDVGAVLGDLRGHQPVVQPTTGAPEADPVQACRQYLENRLSYFDYAGALKAGLPIGSGEVESAHRSVIQARLKLAGAWWQEETAEDMLALRTLRANDQWETYTGVKLVKRLHKDALMNSHF
jgi:hypothetical protein